MGCPQCGSEILGTVAAHYEQEVRRPGADPVELDPYAPPGERHKVHLFVLAVLVWISLLAPFFAPEGHVWRTTLPIWFLTLLWIPIFRHSRKADAVKVAHYGQRRRCERCGWMEP